MDKLTGFGIGFEEAIELPDYKHEFMFKYLQVSPSYWLAHRIISLGEAIPKEGLPKDFEDVLNTYRKIGDVYQIEFYEWWLNAGKNVFGKDKKRPVWLGIDPSKPKEQLRKEFEKFLSKLDDSNVYTKDEKITFEVNKIRLNSLHHRFELVHERAWRYGKQHQKEPLWKLIRFCQYPSEKRKEIRINSRRKQSNVEVRSYLTMLASKNLKLALYTAENAARGKFPCQDPIDGLKEFDYERIAKLEVTYEPEIGKIKDFRNQNKNYMKYISPSQGHKRTRKKIPKYNIDEAMKKE